jgi:hypothetical protein
VFELVEAFYALRPRGKADGGEPRRGHPGLRLRSEVLAGTWEALVSGQADLAIGVGDGEPARRRHRAEPLGELAFVFAMAPHHPLAAGHRADRRRELLHHRAVAVADTAQRLSPLTVNLLPGQDVLTVPSMARQDRGAAARLGCGFVPEPLVRAMHVAAGRPGGPAGARRARRPCSATPGAAEPQRASAPLGLALQWWLQQLDSPATRRALLERHAGLADGPGRDGRRPDGDRPLHVGRFAPVAHRPAARRLAGGRAGQLAGRPRPGRALAGAHRGRRHAALRARRTARSSCSQLAALGLRARRAAAVAVQPRARPTPAALASCWRAGLAYPCGCSRKRDRRRLGRRGQPRTRHAERVYPGTCRDGLHGKPARAVRLRTQCSGRPACTGPTAAWARRRRT